MAGVLEDTPETLLRRTWFAKNIEWKFGVSSQVLFYIVLAAFAGFLLYRYLKTRSVPRLSPAEADRMVNSGLAVFLDVRTESEQRSEHIRGAMHIPLHELRRRADEMKKHSGREIICYCRNGSRSLAAAAILRSGGMRASSLAGGIGDWNFYKRAQK